MPILFAFSFAFLAHLYESTGRAIALPPASAAALALAKCSSFYIYVFHVMDKALTGELSCPCDRTCLTFCMNIQ